MGKKFILCLNILLVVFLLINITACKNSVSESTTTESYLPQSDNSTNNVTLKTASPAPDTLTGTDDKEAAQISDEPIETTANSDIAVDNTANSSHSVSDNKTSEHIYKVRVTMASSDTQIGAFKNLENAKKRM